MSLSYDLMSLIYYPNCKIGSKSMKCQYCSYQLTEDTQKLYLEGYITLMSLLIINLSVILVS